MPLGGPGVAVEAVQQESRASAMSEGVGRVRANVGELLDAAPDAVILADEEGRILLVNRQAEALFGYDRAELLGEPVEVLVPQSALARHPQQRQRYLRRPLNRAMGSGRELAGRRKDGSEFPAEIWLSSVRTDDGLLVSAAVRDLTERQRTEARHQGLLDAAPDAIVAVDEQGTIRLVNRQAEVLFDHPREELLGQPIELLIPERHRMAHPAHRAGYVAHPITRPMGAGLALAARRRDGTEFPVDISLSSVATDEGMLVTAAVRDITDRKRAEAEQSALEARLRQAEVEESRAHLEAQLHQAQRLESIGQLAGGIAHDFNNLLAGIMNYAELVAAGLDGIEARVGPAPEVATVQDDAREILVVARRAADLVRQLLIFSRREVTSPVVLDLNEVVADMEKLLVRTIGEDVDLQSSLREGLPRTRIDRGQLEQVLMNVAVNARDAMPDGGRLTLLTSEFQADEDYALAHGVAPGPYVRLTVSDTGEGMPLDVAERAFEPFFTTKGRDKGTGLGLATVYGIVTQAGGDVSIYSEPGLGTTVRINLPATAEEVTAPPSTGGGAGSGQGEVILLVEDEAMVREPTRRLLAQRGYRLLVAANPNEALEVAAAAGRIDLLLTDVVMPGMSGRELADRLAAGRPDLAVLYMSGYSQDVIHHQGVLEEGVALVEKPFEGEVLLRAVRERLQGPAVRFGGQGGRREEREEREERDRA